MKKVSQATLEAMAEAWDRQFTELNSRLAVAEQQVAAVLGVLDGAEIEIVEADPARIARNARRREQYAARKAAK